MSLFSVSPRPKTILFVFMRRQCGTQAQTKVLQILTLGAFVDFLFRKQESSSNTADTWYFLEAHCVLPHKSNVDLFSFDNGIRLNGTQEFSCGISCSCLLLHHHCSAAPITIRSFVVGWLSSHKPKLRKKTENPDTPSAPCQNPVTIRSGFLGKNEKSDQVLFETREESFTPE